MFVDLTKAQRPKLTLDQQEFLLKIIPLANYIHEQTQAKCSFRGIESIGVLTSVVAATLIQESYWGTHPVCQDRCQKKSGNNLILLEAGEYWKGPAVEYEDKVYRSYKNWMEFAVNYSDLLVFSGEYAGLLQTPNLIGQVAVTALTKPEPKMYNKAIKTLIAQLNLMEFDEKEQAATQPGR